MNQFVDVLSLAHRISPFVVGIEGNVSQKIDEQFVVKKSGVSLKNLSENGLVSCNLNGISFDKKNRPSMEVYFHSWLYQNTEYTFIAHSHPTNVLKILCRADLISEFANKRLFPDQVVFNGKKSCIIEYITPGIELKNAIAEGVKKFKTLEGYFPKLILLQNHGIIAMGNSVNECVYITEICEKSAKIFYSSKENITNLTYLSVDEVEKLTNDKNEILRQKVTRNEL